MHILIRSNWPSYFRGESQSAACEETYKVDARIIILVNEVENDISNMEAARKMTSQKIDDDHLKLIIESKCALDNIIMNTSSVVEENLNILFIQLSGNYTFWELMKSNTK